MAYGPAVEPVTNNRPLPTVLRVAQGLMPTPNEMRALKGLTGRPLQELLGGDLNNMDRAPDRLQSLAWIALRREGYHATWDQAGDVTLLMVDEAPDPTMPASSSSSSISAVSGE